MRVGAADALLRRRLILVQEAVERLLGFGLLDGLLVAHLRRRLRATGA
jgi:hypothetical protein